ncbi:Cro/C1-type helix-turn-helix domain [Candidatus Nanopelagicaceae bacterium]
MNTQVTIEEVSSKLRAIRTSKSLSLSDVEVLSKGALKAVVLGSYERGARTLSVKRAIAIAELYQVPVSHLFSDENPVELVNHSQLVIDLRAINRRAQDPSHTENTRYQLLARVAQRVVRSRQDWNGEVLSLRHCDLETIAVIFDWQISEVLIWLEDERVLLRKRQD